MPTAFAEPAEYGPGRDLGATHRDFLCEGEGYGLHLSKPQTRWAIRRVGDIWIIEARRTWADTGGAIGSVWTKDILHRATTTGAGDIGDVRASRRCY
jgi:hypothetical protein